MSDFASHLEAAKASLAKLVELAPQVATRFPPEEQGVMYQQSARHADVLLRYVRSTPEQELDRQRMSEIARCAAETLAICERAETGQSQPDIEGKARLMGTLAAEATSLSIAGGDLAQLLAPVERRAQELKTLLDELDVPGTKQSIADWEKRARDWEQRRKEAEEGLAKRVEELDDLLGKGSFGIHAGIFDACAKTHEESAARWLVAAALFVAAAVLWLSIRGYFLGADELTASHATYAVVATVLLAIATFCGRTFRTERHNCIVNQQRAAALKAYMAIANTVKDDPQVRNAVVAEISRATFGHQSTGLASGEPAMPIQTIANTVLGKDK